MYDMHQYRAIYRGQSFEFGYSSPRGWLAAREFAARIFGASYATDVILIDREIAGYV